MGRVTFYCNAQDRLGWTPIMHMIRLALKAFDGVIQDITTVRSSRARRWKLMTQRSKRGGDDVAIFIARTPKEIRKLLAAPAFFAPHKARVLWVIDSFRTSHLPNNWLLSHFDVIVYMQAYDRPYYEKRFGSRALFLGWGSDALNLGGSAGDRSFDILRIGRQPDSWDDDIATATACETRGLRFHGRPPQDDAPEHQQRSLMQNWYGQTKFVIAHSNLAAPASYTHDSKEYITGRWTDAIAAGAVVAGKQPRTDLGFLDWPGAVLDFDTIDLEENLDQLQKSCADWTPQTALRNHLGALKRLDWRWRFKTLADHLALDTPDLDADIAQLSARIAELEKTLGLDTTT